MYYFVKRAGEAVMEVDCENDCAFFLFSLSKGRIEDILD